MPDSPRRAFWPQARWVPSLLYSRYLEHFASSGRIKNLTIVRFFGAYGPFEAERKIYGRLVRQFGLKQDPRFTVRGNGRNLIDAMYIDDAIRAIRLLLCNPNADGIIDLSSRNPLTLGELVRQAGEAFGLEPQITFEGKVPEYIEFFSTDKSMWDKYTFLPQIGLNEGLQRFAAQLRNVERSSP